MNAQPYSYAEFLRQNPELVDSVMGSASNTAPAPAPAPAPAQRQAVPTPAPEPAAQPAPAEIQIPETRNASLASKEVQGQRVGTYAAMADSFLREGETKAQADEQKTAELTKAAPAARRYAEAAVSNHDENTPRQKVYKQWVDEDVRTLREPPVEPKAWQKTVSTLSQIVGAVAQGWLGPVGVGVAIGMDAIDRKVRESVFAQLEAKDRAGRALPHELDAIDKLSENSSDEADVAHKLVANHYLAAEAELNRIASAAKSTEDREAAKRLALEAKQKGLDILQRGYDQQVEEQRRLAAARAAAATRADDKAWNRYKDMRELQIKEDAAGKASRAAALAAVPPVGRDVVNPDVWASVGDTEKAKYRKAEAAMGAFARDAAMLDQMLADYGTEAWGEHSQTMEALQSNLMGAYKEIKDLGALDNGVINLTDRAMGDPTALFKNGPAVRAKLQSTLQSLNAGMDQTANKLGLSARRSADVGFNPLEQKKPAQPSGPYRGTGSGPAAPPASSRVTMYDPQGVQHQVKPKLVEGFKSLGFTLQPPSRPDLANMSEDEYMAWANKQSGYAQP